MKIFAYLFISFFLLLPFIQDENDKKKVLSQVVAQYLPESLAIIEEYPAKFVNQNAKGDSLAEYVFGLPLIIHEGYHQYSGLHRVSVYGQRDYRLNDTLTISVVKFESFPSREINTIVSKEERDSLFRYTTYVDSKSVYHTTQKNGILGLLEEYNAYYQEFKMYLALHDFIKDNYAFSDPLLWQRYLCNLGSVSYALDEFHIFISWYLQVAKAQHPDVYQKIISDKNIKTLFTYISKENQRLKNDYKTMRQEVLTGLKGKCYTRKGFLFCDGYKFGKGLHDKQAVKTKEILNKPQHQILANITFTD